MEDTIAAVATGRGAAGIGIIRISGSDAFNIVKRCFVGKRKIEWDKLKGYNAFYGKMWTMGKRLTKR